MESGFRMRRRMREFSADLRLVKNFGPEVIVAPLQVALSLADQKMRGVLELPTLRVALVILTQSSPMDQQERDVLWRAFGLPVFEQLRDLDGTVIARECEVHDGLHVDGNVVLSPLDFEMTTAPCECGAETPRICSPAPARQTASITAA